jgi:hypothetical protein
MLKQAEMCELVLARTSSFTRCGGGSPPQQLLTPTTTIAAGIRISGRESLYGPPFNELRGRIRSSEEAHIDEAKRHDSHL